MLQTAKPVKVGDAKPTVLNRKRGMEAGLPADVDAYAFAVCPFGGLQFFIERVQGDGYDISL